MLKKITIPFQVVFLILFEIFAFTVFGRGILGFSLGRGYLLHVFLIGVFVLLVFYFFLFNLKIFGKSDYYKLILPTLIGLSTYVFLFFSPSLVLGEIVILLSMLFSTFLLLTSEEVERFSFVNLASFFSIFLFYFFAYASVSYVMLPYWIVVLAVVAFSVSILFYKLKSIGLENKYLQLFTVTLAIVVTEFFVFLFFVPLKSIIVKSLLLVLIYFFYWGMLDLYVRKLLVKKNILIFLVNFIALTMLITIYSFVRGK